MPLLQSVRKMRARLGFPDTEDVNEAIEAALESAGESITDAIRSPVDRVAVIDTFFVQSNLEFGPTVHQTRHHHGLPSSLRSHSTVHAAAQTVLKLSRGFVDTGEVITAFAAATENGLDETDERQDLTDVDGDDRTMVEAERGMFRVSDFTLSNCYLRISYTSGLPDDGGSPALYTSAPGWLKEAVSLEASLILNANPIIRRDALPDDERTSIQRKIDQIVVSHSRYAPMGWKPIHSVVTAV